VACTNLHEPFLELHRVDAVWFLPHHPGVSRQRRGLRLRRRRHGLFKTKPELEETHYVGRHRRQ